MANIPRYPNRPRYEGGDDPKDYRAERKMMTVDPKYFLDLEYKWEPSLIEKKPGTILSKMVKFHGEKMFRAGLKNQASSSTLLFMTFDVAKIGMHDVVVIFSSHNVHKIMEPYKEEGAANARARRVQLYTTPFDFAATGNYSFIFKVYMATKEPNYYSFKRLDCLLGQQLWSAAMNKVATDYELTAEGKTFFVHKFVLAARSPVFAAQFTNTAQVGSSPSRPIRDIPMHMPHATFSGGPFNLTLKKGRPSPQTTDISYDDATSLEQFLKYLYTGTLEGAVSYQLKTLATTHQIDSLMRLCDKCLPQEAELVEDLARLALLLKTDSTPLEIKPNVESEIEPRQDTCIQKIVWNVPPKDVEPPVSSSNSTERSKVSEGFSLGENSDKGSSAKITLDMQEQEITIFFLVHQDPDITSIIVQEVACAVTGEAHQVKMTPKPSTGKGSSIKIFSRKIKSVYEFPKEVTFFFKITSTVPTFSYNFVDRLFGEHLWTVARNNTLTDVEFNVGSNTFPAHRSLLIARSSIFAAMFKNSETEEARTGKVHINDVDPDTFSIFLRFLYAGEINKNCERPLKKKLFTLAYKYQVETLLAICKSSPAGLGDMEEMMDAFFSC